MDERAPENRVENYPHARLSQWTPDLPAGRIDRIYTHWSAHDYHTVFPAYHFCIALDDRNEIVVVQTHDIVENMREVYEHPELPYAAHTRARNSRSIGVSIMAMQDATPHDFGRYPLTAQLIEALCAVCAKVAAFYAIPIDCEHVLSHAEAALHDGYFGAGAGERWDIARLYPEDRALIARDAIDTGEALRRRIRELCEKALDER